jgi:hypothetical protein
MLTAVQLLCTLLQLTKVDDNLERSIEVNEIEWSSDHNPHVSTENNRVP